MKPKQPERKRNAAVSEQADAVSASGNGGMVNIYIMGKEYEVPSALTIMKAMEYAGYSLVRGCGCRGGVCGACSTVYRTGDDYRIKVGLACQTVIEPGMHMAQIPFYPANKAVYDIEKLEPTAEDILGLYPEIARCLCCEVCTRACPQDLEVMYYMQAALRGDCKEVARLSFECIMCGLCVSRCPAELMHYNAAILCRRLHARYGMKRAEHVATRVREIEEGKFDKELSDLVAMGREQLVKAYEARDIEEA
jgi:formate hydrogenlyase subunit 6/NADH:ubiquinone oxidoreductase subunit I